MFEKRPPRDGVHHAEFVISGGRDSVAATALDDTDADRNPRRRVVEAKVERQTPRVVCRRGSWEAVSQNDCGSKTLLDHFLKIKKKKLVLQYIRLSFCLFVAF